MRPAAAGLLAAALCGCAHSPPYDPDDPLEPVNRAIYSFNETADAWVLRPVARGYDFVMPSWARTGVRNFFGNLFYPTVIVNDLLQLKPLPFVKDLGRLVVNTTIGIGGLFDPATPLGLPANDEDFGQTLGYWGVGPGWYLMLPLLGPTTNRDLIGRVGDYFTDPLNWYEELGWEELAAGCTSSIVDRSESAGPMCALELLNLVETRAGLLPADRALEQQLDRYVFVRTFFLERRLNRVHDGNPPKEDFDFE